MIPEYGIVFMLVELTTLDTYGFWVMEASGFGTTVLLSGDDIVENLSQTAGVSGARLTGAGFGGCAIALVRTDAVPVIASAVEKRDSINVTVEEAGARVFPIKIDDGARLLGANR